MSEIKETTVSLSATIWNVEEVEDDRNTAVDRGPPGRVLLLTSPYYVTIESEQA